MNDNYEIFESIRPGDRVTILVHAGIGRNGPEKAERTGRAVMRGPAGWVLNMGGRYGTPGIAGPDNFVRVRHSATRRARRAAERIHVPGV